MRILVTGGTGLIGRHFLQQVAGSGHEVVVLTRRPERAGGLPGGARPVAWDGASTAGWGDLVEGSGAVVHLAGEGIADRRWTEERKRRLWQSRTRSTEAVVAAIRGARRAPRILLQASAVGYYGDRGEEEVGEECAAGEGFLAELTAAWEAASAGVAEMGVRRVVLRTGIVLAREGGALPRMALPIRLFVGGPLGSGRQFVPWIHAADQAAAMRFLLERDEASGPFNLSAPAPVRNRDLARAIGRVLHRPTFLPAPGPALRVLLGEMAGSLLTGQRAVPRRLLDLGYRFRFADLGAALRDLLS